MSTLTTLQKNGVAYNAPALIRACARERVPLFIGAAFYDQESHGANIFGHDPGGAMYGAGEVTPAKFAQFLKLINSGHKSNGVGPAQITYKGFFPQARSLGYDLSDPEDNMAFGLRLLKQYLKGYSQTSIINAGRKYNGALAYGYQVNAKANKWKKLLGTGTPSATSSGKGSFPLASGHFFGVDDGTAWSHSGKRGGSDDDNVKKIQKKVGATADGIFGNATKAKVQAFQKTHGLTADGKVGAATWAKLGL